MAVGTAIGVAYTAFDTLMGPSSVKSEAAAAAAAPPPPPAASPAPATDTDIGSVPCTNICKRLVACLESNEFDINKCPGYVDMLKDCQKN